MSDKIRARELLAIRARTARAEDGQHQSLRQTETDRAALLREVDQLRDLDATAGQLEAQLDQVCTCDPGITDSPEEDCPLHGRPEFRFAALRDRVVHLEEIIARVRADCEQQTSAEALHLGDDGDISHQTQQLGVWAQARRTLNILNGAQGTPAARSGAPAGAGETGGTPETQEGRQ